MEDYSTSWSSDGDGDDDTTTSSLDKIEDDATSDANDELLHAHLMVIMMDHARAMRMVFLQAL
jgi:hypothetical protein